MYPQMYLAVLLKHTADQGTPGGGQTDKFLSARNLGGSLLEPDSTGWNPRSTSK